MSKKNQKKNDNFWDEINWQEEKDKALSEKKEDDSKKSSVPEDASDDLKEKQQKSIWDDDDDDDDFDLEWLKKYTQPDPEPQQNLLPTNKGQIKDFGKNQSFINQNEDFDKSKKDKQQEISTEEDKTKNRKWFYAVFAMGYFLLFAGFGATAWMYYKIDEQKHCHGSNVIMSKIYTGDPILINVQDIKRSGSIISRGYIDSQISRLLYNFVKTNDTVIDVGSGFGYYTMYLSRIVGPKGNVYSFEARKETYELLLRSIRMNQLNNVHVYNKLLFSSDGDVLLDHSEKNHWGAVRVIIDSDKVTDNSNIKKIKAQPIDAILPHVNNVSLLHINARGNELSIITGARHLISRSPNIRIITSWHKKAISEHHNIEHIISQFFDLNFRIWLINYEDGELIELRKLSDVLNIEYGRLLIAKSLS